MNDEQSKRLAEAADAVLQANEALSEASESMNDPRLESGQDRERSRAAQQLASRLDNAAKRIEDGLRRGALAAATLGTPGAFARYREAVAAARAAREAARAIPDADGTAQKREAADAAMQQLTTALEGATALVFAE